MSPEFRARKCDISAIPEHSLGERSAVALLWDLCGDGAEPDGVKGRPYRDQPQSATGPETDCFIMRILHTEFALQD
jgi:hypothetical protein